jgi:hypothetical protein
MATTDHSDTFSHLDTAWMPLDGLIQQWGQFGAEADNASALHATSLIFSAFAREMTAHEHYIAAYSTSQKVDMTDLESALEELHQARVQWTDAIIAFGASILDETSQCTKRSEGRVMVAQLMEQRLRVSALIQEIEREQFTAY